MKKYSVWVAVLSILVSQVVLGQESLRQKPRSIDQNRAKQAMKQTSLKPAVTLIDVRNKTVSRSLNSVAQRYTPKDAARTLGRSKAVLSVLSAPQLAEVLHDNGIRAASVNIYMTLSPNQTSVDGKGYLFSSLPNLVAPNFVFFNEDQGTTFSSSSINVGLLEAGVYILDFLVELTDVEAYKAGVVFTCTVTKGMTTTLEIKNVVKANGPQHILVLVDYDGVAGQSLQFSGGATPSGVYRDQLYGIRFDKPKGGGFTIQWKLYEVDVTKM